MRTVISVIDLQSDLERERSRCARKGDPDKAGLLGIFINSVVLITDGNPTFTTGSRHDLLNLLSKWRTDLLQKLPQRKAQ